MNYLPPSLIAGPDEAMNFNGQSYVTYNDLVLSTTSTQFSSSVNTDRPNGIIMDGAGEFDYSVLEVRSHPSLKSQNI